MQSTNLLVRDIPNEIWSAIFTIAVNSLRYQLVCRRFYQVEQKRIFNILRSKFKPTYPTYYHDCDCECCESSELKILRKYKVRFVKNHSDALNYTMRSHGKNFAMQTSNILIENICIYDDYYNRESVILLKVFGSCIGWTLGHHCPKIVWVDNRTEMSRDQFVIFCCEFMSKLFPDIDIFDNAIITGDWSTTYGEYVDYEPNYCQMFGTGYYNQHKDDGKPMGERVFGFRSDEIDRTTFEPNEDNDYIGDVYRKDKLILFKKEWEKT